MIADLSRRTPQEIIHYTNHIYMSWVMSWCVWYSGGLCNSSGERRPACNCGSRAAMCGWWFVQRPGDLSPAGWGVSGFFKKEPNMRRNLAYIIDDVSGRVRKCFVDVQNWGAATLFFLGGGGFHGVFCKKVHPKSIFDKVVKIISLQTVWEEKNYGYTIPSNGNILDVLCVISDIFPHKKFCLI